MFGLFKKEPLKPSVTEDDKKWIETNYDWLVGVFGIQKIKERPFLLPTLEDFPYNDLNNNDQFSKLFSQLCAHLEVDPEEIGVKIFDDHRTKQWETWTPMGSFKEPGGTFQIVNENGGKKYRIRLARSNFTNPEALVTVLAHELSHVKLLGGKYISRNDADMEAFTDLFCIFNGFGVFLANTCEYRDLNWITRSGYLPNEIISYSNALQCYISKRTSDEFYAYFNNNTNTIFKKDWEYLEKTHDTLLIPEYLEEKLNKNDLYKKTDEGFKERDYDKVIEACNSLLAINKKNEYAFNNLGYALLLSKKYSLAIDMFNKAIDINHYFDYPFNNRGYCQLMLNNLEDSLIDIETACDMNPENSFAWRNLGAYNLLNKNYEEALRLFEKAFKLDKETELIHFFFALAYRGLEQPGKAEEHFKLSQEAAEHNDSIFEY